MTNPLKDKNLLRPTRCVARGAWYAKQNGVVRGAWYVTVLVGVACGGKSRSNQELTPAPTAPLPTAGLASQRVPVLPLTLLAAEDSLGWDSLLADHRAALGRADSVLGALLVARAPEVTWVFAEELRRAARRAPTVAVNPDQMGTAVLRAEAVERIPDPLASELRTLVALAGARYALVPAALVYRRSGGPAVGQSDVATLPKGTAELSVVLVDARFAQVGWRTVARGAGEDPWTALTRAVKALMPGLP